MNDRSDRAGANESPARTDDNAALENRGLSPAAQRALREAEERRRAVEAEPRPGAREVGGRDGPDPVRYGDWEKGGIISDF